jgi:hypothetical protein
MKQDDDTRHCGSEPNSQLGLLTDEEIEAAAKAAGGRWQDGSYWVFEDADLHPFVRGLLAAERERNARIVERINGWVGTREIAAEIRGETQILRA